MALVEEFPIARSGAVMFVYDHQLMLWGGMTQVVLGEGEDRFNIDVNLPEIGEQEDDDDEEDGAQNEMYVEIFDLKTREWKKQIVDGDVPTQCRGSLHVVVGNTLYLFGGYNEPDGFSNTLYALNLDTFKWWKPKQDPLRAPTHKFLGGMVAFGKRLVVFGGYGSKAEFNETHGATLLPNETFGGGNSENGWNNALHEYNIDTGEWNECSCTGERPPPCDKFTFNQLDKQRAILFGGKQSKYKVAFNEVYILTDSEEGKEMHFDGPFRPQAGQQWPVGRGLHAAACLVDPQSDLACTDQELMVVWGQGWDAKHVKDIWILHIQSMTWRKWNILLRPRMFHMGCSYYHGDRHTDVLVYGGNKQRQSKFERHVMTDLIIFKFGSLQSLHDMCVKMVSHDHQLYSKGLAVLPPKIQSVLSSAKGVDVACHIIYPHDRFGSIQTLQEMCIRFACGDQELYEHSLSSSVLQPHFKSALKRAKDADISHRIVYPRDIDFQ